jgi:site-specific DNA recombinase
MTRVCLYTRISTDEENQPTSLHSQRERLEAFCTAQDGWRIVAHEEDRSTGTKLDRPGLGRALDLARASKIDLLLVYRVDRLSRKVRQLAQLAEELDRIGVVLRSATEPFDTGSAAGRMMLQMLGVFAEFEHATIVDRVSAGIERRAKEGRWATGRLPFGYRRNDRKDVVPDERTAPTVKRIFELYTSGRLGTAAIARQLADEQAAAPSAGWQPAVVQLVLQNEAYLGRVLWRGQSLPGRHEPLVDELSFERAHRLLRERGEDMALRRSNPGDYLLSGLVRCGRCRRAYVAASARGNGGLYHYYACSGRQKLGRKACDGERIPRDKLEAAVIHQLANLYRDGTLIREALDAATAKAQRTQPALEEQRRALADEIRRAERALVRYYAGFEAGDLDAKRPGARVRPRGAPRRPARARRRPRPTTHPTSRDGARHRRTRGRRRQPRNHHRHRRAAAGESPAPAADQRPPRQRPDGDPPDLPRRHTRGLRTAKFSGAYRDRTGDLRLAKPALSQTELTPRTCMVEPNRGRCALPILMRFLPRRFSCSSALAPSHEDREDNPPVS